METLKPIFYRALLAGIAALLSFGCGKAAKTLVKAASKGGKVVPNSALNTTFKPTKFDMDKLRMVPVVIPDKTLTTGVTKGTTSTTKHSGLSTKLRNAPAHTDDLVTNLPVEELFEDGSDFELAPGALNSLKPRLPQDGALRLKRLPAPPTF